MIEMFTTPIQLPEETLLKSVGPQSKCAFFNLNYGTYQLTIFHPVESQVIKITVLPPWYLSLNAYCLLNFFNFGCFGLVVLLYPVIKNSKLRLERRTKEYCVSTK